MFKPPKGENAIIWHVGLMIVALTLMCAVGFLFLWFKSELDVNRLSAEIGTMQGHLMKERMDEKQKKAPECVNVGDRVCTTAEKAPGIRITTDIRPEDFCRAKTTCEIQADGECGWTSTPEFETCMENPPPPPYMP